MDTAKNVSKQTPISGKEGWDGWSMRIFTLGKDGYTPRHKHSWPHINYIIKGTGTLFIDGEEKPVKQEILHIYREMKITSLKIQVMMKCHLYALCRKKAICRKI